MSPLRRLIHEIHRRSLWQILGIYAVTSWVIWQVVLSLRDGVGLPDWVPPTALVLLLVGLPIVLATAFVQEGGPARGGMAPRRRPRRRKAEVVTDAAGHDASSGRTSRTLVDADTSAASPPTPSAFFTWPRAITAGVLAFALLGLAATGFMGMRTMGIGPAGTLVSRGVLDEREPVLLAEFESPSGDSILAIAVTEALRVDLEQARVVTLLQPAFAHDALRRMGRDPTTRLTSALAVELAVREGVKAVVVGDVTAAGSSYILTARVLGSDGSVLVSARETANIDGIIAATDRLSRTLRERMGESLRALRRAEPLAQVTTPSLDALRRYSQAQRAWDTEDDPRRAIALLREALEHDSAFAMAWRKLGVAYQNIDMDSMQHAVGKAYAHRDRLSDRERYITEGSYHDIVAHDTTRAMTAYETLLELYPDDATGLNNLGRLQVMKGNLAAAAELYGRSIAAHSYASVPYRNRFGVLTRLNRLDEAAAVIDAYEAQFAGHYYVPRMRRQLAEARFDYDEAWRQAELLAQHEGRAQEAGFALGALEIVRGRHRAGLRRTAEAAELDTTSGPGRTELGLNRVFLDVMHRLEPVEAADRLARLLPDAALAALPVERRPYAQLAGVNLLAGRIDVARRHLEQWRRARPEAFEAEHDDVRDLMAEFALYEDDAQFAFVERRRQIANGCVPCRVHLGRAFETAGMPDSAIAAYHSYLEPEENLLGRLFIDRWFLPFVIQRLAALHEQQGDVARALEFHTRLLELWQDADPELGPRVETARRAVERLAGERARPTG
jgi:eukaryotic-like serine/threonine-protein kinase